MPANAKTFSIATEGDKEFTGYLSLPPAGSGPGILLLQEVYGVNEDIRALSDLFASEGYVVLAPDHLFWRKEKGLVFRYGDRENARAAINESGGDAQASLDIVTAFDALGKLPETAGRKVGLVGFGFGGILAFKGVASQQLTPDFGIGYFPARLQLPDAANLRQPWLFHLPEFDAVAEAGLYQKASAAFAARKDVDVRLYPGLGHGFAIPGRPEFDDVHAARAHAQSFGFLSRVAV